MDINFGGFVPLSTVDWRGKAVCALFFRGCTARCYYCHNQHLQQGERPMPIENILTMIDESRMLISGIIFSGGECTEQPQALLQLITDCKDRGLAIGIHTNGAHPEVCRELVGKVDKVSLDIKASWSNYSRVTGINIANRVKESYTLLRDAHRSDLLPSFEVVHTLIRGHEPDVLEVAKATEGSDLVIQQGLWKHNPPLSLIEIQTIADQLNGRPVKIRTVSTGEVLYQDGSFSSGGGISTRNGKQLQAYHKFGVGRGD